MTVKNPTMICTPILLVLITSIALPGGVMAGDLLSDIYRIREKDNRSVIDITDTVERYIRPGETKQNVIEQLTKLKFNISLSKKPAPEELFAYRYLGRGIFAWLGFRDEVRIIVEFKEGTVTTARGKLIYRAL